MNKHEARCIVITSSITVKSAEVRAIEHPQCGHNIFFRLFSF